MDVERFDDAGVERAEVDLTHLEVGEPLMKRPRLREARQLGHRTAVIDEALERQHLHAVDRTSVVLLGHDGNQLRDQLHAHLATGADFTKWPRGALPSMIPV